MGRHIQYTVSLNQEEKAKLDRMSKDNKLPSRLLKRVLILLALDNKDVRTDQRYRFLHRKRSAWEMLSQALRFKSGCRQESVILRCLLLLQMH